MTRIHDDSSPSIGRTPLVRLNRVNDGAAAEVAWRLAHRAGSAGLPPA